MDSDVRDRSALLTSSRRNTSRCRAPVPERSREPGSNDDLPGQPLRESLALRSSFREVALDDFRLFALVILPALVFLGTVTFVRVVETGIEDVIYALAINRIRQYYLELAGDDARYFTLGGNDDIQGGLANMGLSPSPWRPFFSVASVIALINSMVAGALTGITLDIFAPRTVSLIAGAALAVAALTVHFRLGQGRFVRAMERFTPQFPSAPDAAAAPGG